MRSCAPCAGQRRLQTAVPDSGATHAILHRPARQRPPETHRAAPARAPPLAPKLHAPLHSTVPRLRPKRAPSRQLRSRRPRGPPARPPPRSQRRRPGSCQLAPAWSRRSLFPPGPHLRPSTECSRCEQHAAPALTASLASSQRCDRHVEPLGRLVWPPCSAGRVPSLLYYSQDLKSSCCPDLRGAGVTAARAHRAAAHLSGSTQPGSRADRHTVHPGSPGGGGPVFSRPGRQPGG